MANLKTIYEPLDEDEACNLRTEFYRWNLQHILRNMSKEDCFTGFVTCEPMKEIEEEEGTSTEYCEPEEAEFWGVYVHIRRKDSMGVWFVYEWVEDFYTEEDAQVFSKELGDYIRANFELVSEKELKNDNK